MTNNSRPKNRIFFLTGLGLSLLIAFFLSPFASQAPDGLDRVSQDLEFEHKAEEKPLAHKLPFASWFEEYSLTGVPKSLATPLAGLIGTLATFGLAWGIGKLVMRSPISSETAVDSSYNSEQKE